MVANDLRPEGEKTLEMTVENTGFLVDRLGQDCAPLQYLRELTQNSIEAVLRNPTKTGQIVWDMDWVAYDLDGHRRLCITDTGHGMTGAEMGQYINRLSSSAHLQDMDRNFGVGAKIAAATRNHAGMLYLSWQDSHGEMAHLWRDPTTGKYGLRQLVDADYVHWAPVDPAVKPDLIMDHGTKVVLHGMEDDADTMSAPVGVGSPSRWVSKYLNTRYYAFPEGIEVKAREGWTYPVSDAKRNVLRRITGQRDFLQKNSDASGEVALTDATARWWILTDSKSRSQQSGAYAASGHIGALFQNELYEMYSGRSGVALLQQFGVLFGHGRVVVYVEPHGENVGANTSRTRLLIENKDLPWSEWAQEFRSAMPNEIENHMNDVTAGSGDGDRGKAIRDRLKRIEHLLRLTRYRRAPAGEVQVDDEAEVGGNETKAPPEGERGQGASTSGGRRGPGRAGGVYALFIKDDGDPADPEVGSVYPEVDWVSLENGKREPGDLEDRAARYLHEQNRLLINEDFRVFVQLIDTYVQQYGDKPAVRREITDEVHQWFEQVLVEVVLSAHSLNGRHWTIEDVKQLFSEEALTAAILPRYHIDNSVKRGLGARLGSLKDKAA